MPSLLVVSVRGESHAITVGIVMLLTTLVCALANRQTAVL